MPAIAPPCRRPACRARVAATSAVRAVTCPGCGKPFSRTLAWLKANSVVACPDCRKEFHVRQFKAQAGAAAEFHKLTGFTSDPKGS